jgi:hypothetical protein
MTAQDHPTFVKPPDIDVKIWRYMSLAKFLWMLQKNALYFSRSDLMGDPFEGHYSKDYCRERGIICRGTND